MRSLLTAFLAIEFPGQAVGIGRAPLRSNKTTAKATTKKTVKTV